MSSGLIEQSATMSSNPRAHISHQSVAQSIRVSAQFNQWLVEQELSLGFTTYQTNRLFFVGGQANGRLKLQERLFDKPMGLCAQGDRLWMTTRYQLWEFNNLLKPEVAEEQEGSGRRHLYMPHKANTTGDINAHEVVLDGDGQVIFVNTDFSCLATLSSGYSFVPIWRPPFISKLVAEDRCHLNGLAMVEGKPKYVTACSATDTPAGWRNCRHGGGVVMDVETNEMIATGLSMPHSPRWYQGKLWLMNSGTGEFGWIEDGQFQPLTFCPGFVRGLAFWQNFAVVGLSKLRSSSFTGLPLADRLAAEGNEAHCGLMVIDLNTGEVAHWLHVGSTIEELFDVVVLPGVRQAETIGLQGDEVQRLVRFPGSDGIVSTKPTVKRPNIGQSAPVAGLPKIDLPDGAQWATQPRHSVKFQRVYHLTPENALDYDEFTFPRLSQRWQQTPPRGELIGIAASVNQSLVGFAIAEQVSADTAELISLFVIPECQRNGIGTRLVAYVEQAVQQQGCHSMILQYQPNEMTQVALASLLKRRNWPLPIDQGPLRQTQKYFSKSKQSTA